MNDGEPILVDGAHHAVYRGPVTGRPLLSWVDMYRSSLIVPDRLSFPTRRLVVGVCMYCRNQGGHADGCPDYQKEA